jgi:hypothetical protein
VNFSVNCCVKAKIKVRGWKQTRGYIDPLPYEYCMLVNKQRCVDFLNKKAKQEWWVLKGMIIIKTWYAVNTLI